MDGHTQSLLLGAIITLAITLSVLLRSQKDLRQRMFIIFSTNLSLWYMTDFFSRWLGPVPWDQLKLVFAILLPLSGLIFFRAFTGAIDPWRYKLLRVSGVLGLLLLVIVLSPYYQHALAQAAVLAYVLGFLLFAVVELGRHAHTVTSRTEAARIRYLVWGAVVAVLFLLLDRLPALGISFPPIGSSLTLIYLYLVSQAISSRRLFDLYEMLGRLAVLVALALTLALIFTGMVFWAKSAFFLNALLASLIILILFDPLREQVEQRIHDFFLRERGDFETRIDTLRRHISHIFDLDQLMIGVVHGLEESRRMTHAAIYLMDASGQSYGCQGFFGPPPLDTLEGGEMRVMQSVLEQRGVVVAERLEEERERLLLAGRRRDGVRMGHVLKALRDLRADVAVPLEGEKQILGFLSVADERRKDSFSMEEIGILQGLADQLAISIENSQLYHKMQERDRLVALGQMAAGLAHEIRNPLGAIKAAAQLMEEPSSQAKEGMLPEKEILEIIVEEVDRLDNVVSAFLDYARPFKGKPDILDINEVLRRTLQILSSEPKEGVEIAAEYGEGLPEVRMDPDRLHQVFINLIRNAVEAMAGKAGKVSVVTRQARTGGVDIEFRDTGPGIPLEEMPKLFIPFFTTKDRGTGLGLAICQRILRSAGGTIDIQSDTGKGTTVTVSLPPANPAQSPATTTIS